MSEIPMRESNVGFEFCDSSNRRLSVDVSFDLNRIHYTRLISLEKKEVCSENQLFAISAEFETDFMVLLISHIPRSDVAVLLSEHETHLNRSRLTLLRPHISLLILACARHTVSHWKFLVMKFNYCQLASLSRARRKRSSKIPKSHSTKLILTAEEERKSLFSLLAQGKLFPLSTFSQPALIPH